MALSDAPVSLDVATTVPAGVGRITGRDCLALFGKRRADGAFGGFGTAPWAEQLQQRQATVQRRLKKPPRVSSLRGSSGKKTGGQKGHPGETLRRTETPDTTIDHYPPACTTCGAGLTTAMATDHVARQVFDLPEPALLIVTEHPHMAAAAWPAGHRPERHFPRG